ncbi:S-adenosylmethionine decarboxylase [Candidatus Caldatribacterium sp.]|uniref:S-adenosylmethionine decarboxylase n=1 Tax=Candidatus Caldatribacterium sp. TaxID=2282143 RepID=UPI0038486352|nr:S-adenosylmethionine decarboxylase [Candidatus Caldatribacterium sp.]
MQFGTHVQIDLQTKRPPTERTVLRFIQDLINDLKLHVVFGPQIARHNRHLTALAIIAESHISVSCYGSTVFIDVFSCVPIDKDTIIRLCSRYFAPVSLRERVFPRGNLTEGTKVQGV